VHDAVRDALAATLSYARVVPTYGDLRAAAPRASIAAFAVAEAESPHGVRESAPPVGLLDEGSPAVDAGRRAVPLAQYRDSYIVAEDGEGLILVDQHVAHERVLYERYLAEAERGEVAVQRLLFPKTIEVSADEAVVLDAEAAEFSRLGFPLETFGEGAIKLEGVPAFAKDAVPERLLRELLGEAGRTRSAATGAAELRRRLVTTAACHAAIKVNYPLTREGMQRLLDDLFQTENPSTCPHGRPILFRLTREDIERAFRRR
jgi:DNA mismatch repair protein MutL